MEASLASIPKHLNDTQASEPYTGRLLGDARRPASIRSAPAPARRSDDRPSPAAPQAEPSEASLASMPKHQNDTQASEPCTGRLRDARRPTRRPASIGAAPVPARRPEERPSPVRRDGAFSADTHRHTVTLGFSTRFQIPCSFPCGMNPRRGEE